jgi:hypothetical protein
MVAAQKIIHARYGKQFKVEGCDPPTESEYWTFYVKDIRIHSYEVSAADPIITLHPDEMNEVARKDLYRRTDPRHREETGRDPAGDPATIFEWSG